MTMTGPVAPLTEVEYRPIQSASVADYLPPTPTGPALDPTVWVECLGKNLLASVPSWKPFPEVPQEERLEPLNTDPGDDQARAPETLEVMASQHMKLVFAPD